MGKGRPRKAENGVLGGNLSGGFLGGSGSLKIPAGPVFYPSEEEFKDPLEYIYKIRPEAEPYGICKIVPPASWKSPFALDMDTFTFPTKTQAIHQLQARCASCDPKTFALEYHRFLEEHCHKKASKRVVFEGEDLDLCKLFNTVKRFGWYDKVVETKKWGEVFRFVRPGRKVLECSKHVLSQLYREHLYDYEEYYCLLNKQNIKSSKRTSIEVELSNANVVSPKAEVSNAKRRRKNKEGEIVKVRYLEEKDFGQICEQCRSGLHGEVMLLCDRCNKGWHIYCLSPPLKRIPPGNWYCLECVNSEKDTFGFVPGKEFSLESFRRMAERVKKKWYGSSATSRVQLEKKFWEIVEGSVGQVEVIYGSDLDTFVYGSGFPRHTDDKPSSLELDIWNKYCDSPWNLSNLPRLQGSMLKTVHQNIAGVMVPWLYIGMLFSSFCWHFEDHCFYSMNYHHWGEPKCWYSVPGNEADAFEKVMRDSLPDLFEAQPDLLFQLVTMLNPSVLQEKGVPVYSIIQEPGNFVITFPRSYHGGFNFGLNCAEAVNFAPADWLPHGGFGAELYRHYHKAAVLSHEELLCVVAKNECDSRTASYLKKELLRIYTNEKNWRERLWRNGVVRSSIMTPRKQPEYVGTEEDPMCVICQQLLYLSAVSCKCRPLAFVCLQHSEHLCECKAVKHCIFYRHTLSELNDLLVKADKHHSTEAAVKSSKELHSEKAIALAKKVKGGHVTHVQLAEEWILRSCRILEQPYSRDAYSCVIEEAEQFLWAGSEMDVVRDIESKLIQAQKWAEDVRACVSRVKLWSNDKKGGTKRVKMAHLDKLLSLHEVPCIEPNSLHLQEYQEKASKLIEEINSALSPSSESSMADWETLYLRVSDLPIKVKESETLKNKLLAVKVWVEGVRMCIVQKSQSSIEVDKLYKLESEMLELQYHCEEADLLTALITRVKTCRSRCNEVLKKSTSLKEVQFFLSEWEDFTVNIPELELLRKYCSDAISWISRVKNVLVNVREREDQENVVDELTCIRRDGSLLQIQVDDFPHLGLELEKARCRVKAFKAMGGENAMEFIQQLISEATVLHIEKEKIFGDVSGRYELAIHWEEKAKHVLSSKAQMTEFEDVLRASEDIGITPPSLQDTKDAVSTAKTWLIKSKPFLCYNSSISATSEPSLKLDDLEGLVVESKHLKVHLEESSLLDEVLNKCLRWKKNASSLLQDLEHLWSSDINGESNMNCFIHRFNSQIFSMESAIKVGTSIGLELDLIPILRDSCCLLNWCIKALSFSDLTPTHKEVEIVWNAAASLPSMNKDSTLMDTVMEALNWLNKSTEILDSCHHGQFEMSSVKEVLAQSKKIKIPFQNIIGRLEDAIKSHNLWLDQVHLFFSFCSEDRSWISMLQLKERGNMEAFACEELEKVLSEVEKVQCWKQQCRDIIKPVEENPLLSALTEIKSNVERSLDVHSNYKNDKVRNSFICCSNAIEDQKVLTCSICKDSLHLDCSKQLVDDSTMFVCKYCEFMNNSKFPRNGLASLKTGQKHLEMDKLVMLISDANDHCLWTDERRVLNHIVDRAHASSACSKELVDFSLAYLSDDLDVVTQNMCIALKAMDVAGIYDAQVNRNFELALARNLWKLQSDKLLRSKEKSTIQKIRHQLKEGLAINIHPEDYFMQKLMEFRDIGLQWVDRANKVSMDGGVLPLHGVFELISEGENLPVSCGKELKLLRDRSMLYCICRRPYDKRAMIACDSCDEWYHFDCINISSAPKFYICPACNHRPREEIFASVPAPLERCGAKFEEPQTPLRRSELRRSSQKAKCDSVEAEIHRLGSCSDSDSLMWRNRKPFRRVARKRSEMKSLSPFFYDSNKM